MKHGIKTQLNDARLHENTTGVIILNKELEYLAINGNLQLLYTN